MNLEQVEKEIYDTYRFFAVTAPGIQPKESGRLQQLWRYFDSHVND